MADSTLWQHPFVNVFKLCGAEQGKNAHHEGDVMSLLDKDVGKKVLRVWGNISAANYLQLPKFKSQSLALTGRFLYIQIKTFAPKLFTMHLEVTTSCGHLVHISVANLFKKTKSKEPLGSRKHVNLSWEPTSSRWSMLVLDLPAIVANQSSLVYASLKSLQLCSYMLVRGAYTSDVKYTPQTLPREMALPLGPPSSPVFDTVWLPVEPADAATPASPARALPAAPLKDRNLNSIPSEAARAQDAGPRKKCVRVVNHRAPAKRAPARSPRSPGAVSSVSRDDDSQRSLSFTASPGGVSPDPIMELQHVIGMGGEHARALTWCPSGREVVYVCNHSLVAQDTQTGVQRFFLGHTADVVAVAFSGDGQVLATAQEGKTPIIRIWNFATGACAGILCGHASGLIALDVSQDGRAVAGVGLDQFKHQLIVIWDISKVPQGEKARQIVKHTTEFHIKCIKFSPFEEDRLFTCGTDSIRCYRLKGGQLRGISVQLGEHRHSKKKAPPGPYADDLYRNTFTDLAFEMGYGLQELDEKHIFVASVSGAVFQLNYGRRCLECVYQLHSAAINSIVVSEGFCVTGSDDRFLRVWPVDFTDFFLEAEHEAPITSIGVSMDGLQLAVGTENGSVGLLDIPTHKYATLLRSHTNTVHAVALDPHNARMCTAAADGSIRIWNTETFQQLLEFVVPGECCYCAMYHPYDPVVACGFGKGLVRIFSVAETRMIHEHKQHKGAVRQLLFSPDGFRMFTAGEEGNLCVYDCSQNFLPIKYLATALPSCHAAMALSPDGGLLASLGTDATFVLLFDATTLTPHSRMDLSGDAITNLAFSPDSTEIVITTREMRLERYEVISGRFVCGVGPVHKTACEAMTVDASATYIFTGGHDRVVKVWPYDLPEKQGCAGASLQHPSPPSVGQSFMAHSDSVGTVVVDEERKLVISTGLGNAVFVWRFFGDSTGGHTTPPLDQANLDLSNGDSLLQSTDDWMDDILSNSDQCGDAVQEGDDSSVGPQPRPTDCLPRRQDQAVSQLGAGDELAGDNATASSARALTSSVAKEHVQRQAEQNVLLRSMQKRLMVGYNCCFEPSSPRPDNIVWDPQQGILAYPVGRAVILEELTTRQQRHLELHTSEVACLALSNDSSTLASAGTVVGDTLDDGSSLGFPATSGDSRAGDILLWSVVSGECTGVLHFHTSTVHAMCFSPNGRLLVSLGADPDQSVVVWNTHHKDLVAVAKCDGARGPMRAISWRPEAALGEFLTLNNGEVILWTLEDTPGSPSLASHCTVLPTREAPEASAGNVAPRARSYTSLAALDRARVLVGDSGGGLWQVDIEKGSIVWHLGSSVSSAIESGGAVHKIWACTAGKVVVSGGDGGKMVVWAEKIPSEPSRSHPDDPPVWYQVWEVDLDGPVVTFVLDRAGEEGVVATEAGTVWYINMINHTTSPLLGGHPQAVTSMAVSDDGALMATACLDGTLRMWETQFFSKIMQFEMPNIACACMAMSPSGQTCTVGYSNGSACVWNLEAVEVVGTIAAFSSSVTGLAYLPGEDHVVAANADGLLVALDTRATNMLTSSNQLVGHSSELAVLLPLPLDANKFLVGWSDRLDVMSCKLEADSLSLQSTGARLDLSARAESAPSCEGSVKTVAAFAKYELHVVLFTSAATANQILFFDTAQGTMLRYLQLHNPACSLAMSPDGRLLGVGYADGAVRVCGYSTEMHEYEREGFVSDAGIDTLAFLGNRRLIGSSNQILHVWDVDTPEAQLPTSERAR